MMVKKHRKASRVCKSSRSRRQTNAEAVIALLDEWLKDESAFDEETSPELKKALDRDRLSDRKLFDE
jgi:hypothetical protein